MKMKKYYPVLLSRAKAWLADKNHRQMWVEHVKKVIEEGELHTLEVRLAWDMADVLTTEAERSEWAHDCGAVDKNLTILFIRVAKDSRFI